jgi:hypothetical protein
MSSIMRFDEWQDSNGVPVATGAGGKFVAPGAILQVVQTVNTTPVSTTSTSYGDASGIAVTITPTSASSKILLSPNLFIQNSINRTIELRWKATSGTTPILFGRIRALNAVGGASEVTYSPLLFHSPNTTSAVTYQLEWKVDSGETQTISFNNSVSTITAMEVAS